MAHCNHLTNFSTSVDQNPKQFPDLSTRLGGNSAPTLLSWGCDDAGLRTVDDLGGLQNAQMRIVNLGGHWAQWERTQAFNWLLIDFLTH